MEFRFSDDQWLAVVPTVIEAIPSYFSFVSGELFTPSELVAAGDIIETTGFRFGETYAQRPFMVVRSSPDGVLRKPDICGILIEKKHPGFVQFDKAGMTNGSATCPLDFSVVKKIVVAFVRLGYYGDLVFVSPFGTCWVYSSVSNIEVTWLEKRDGRSGVEPIIIACRALGLQELP